MSNAALSAKVFSLYLFVIGPVLVFAPNFLLGLFGIATTSEVWIRVVGVIAINLGVYSLVAAQHENTAFLKASVYTRLFVFGAFTLFAVTGLASPMLILFGCVDLGGSLWTYFALKADGQAAASVGPTR